MNECTSTRSLPHLLEARADQDPNGLYFSFEGVQYTFAEVRQMVHDVREWLDVHGAKSGDRIAVMMDSSPIHIAIIIALAASGLTWVPINTRQRRSGLRYIVEHVQPAFILTTPAHRETLIEAGVSEATGKLLVLADSRIPASANVNPRTRPVKLAEPSAIMYTSGTTGPPKGVVLTHAMMRYAVEAVMIVSDARDGDIMFMWEPLFHIGGAQMLLVPLIRRVSLAMVARFSASRFWQQVIESRATHIHYLGGILDILLSNPASHLDRVHSVRIAWGAGSSKDTWQAFEDRFGVQIRECYGMSEASSFTTANVNRVIGSVGTALPWFAVEICDPDGAPLAPDQAGNIVVTALQDGALFAGYFRNEEASARVLRGGRLYTGDLGRLDHHGNLYFLGRITDSVRHKGENVSAWEVESVANKHEWVTSSAMIGVPGALGEQDIALFVQPVAGSNFDVPAFCGWLSEELAPYQVPRYIQLISAFERTPSARIIKSKLALDPTRCWDRLGAHVRLNSLRSDDQPVLPAPTTPS